MYVYVLVHVNAIFISNIAVNFWRENDVYCRST